MNWAAVARIGLKVASVVIPQIGAIEQLAEALPVLRGQQKEDAVVALTKQALKDAEEIAGKDLLNDPAFEAAVRAFTQSYVALQNVVNTKLASAQN